MFACLLIASTFRRLPSTWGMQAGMCNYPRVAEKNWRRLSIPSPLRLPDGGRLPLRVVGRALVMAPARRSAKTMAAAARLAKYLKGLALGIGGRLRRGVVDGECAQHVLAIQDGE